jgi:MFS family permease
MQTNWTKLRLLAAAGAISWMGSTLTTFTVVLRYKDEFGPSGVSAIMLSMILPTILAAPYGGVLADKFNSGKLIPTLLSIMGLSTFMLSLDLGFAWSLAFLAITAACGTPVGAAFNATLPEYSSPDDLPRVNGLMQTGSSLGAMLGPGVAGFLVSSTDSYAWPFRIDAISFLILAAAIIALRINRAPQPHVEGEKMRSIDGLKLIMQNSLVRSLVILVSVCILAVSVINIGEVFLVMNILKADAFTYGIVSATFALGSVLGAITTSVIKVPEKRHASIVVLALVVLALITSLLGFAWHWAVVAVAWFIAGCFNAALNAYGVSLIMNRTPEATRGRVMAAVGALFSSASVAGMGIAGLLIAAFGIRTVLGFAGAICFALILVLAPALLKASKQELTPELVD